ncbi:MAG TPA: hypothetical protein VK817_17415 [Trebonia sp.]|nr:hypothetical protein [Trebonia sp.]
MSKKNRRHQGPASQGTAKISPEAGEQMLDAAFNAVWQAVDAGDVVTAEIECSALLTLPDKAGIEPAAAREYLDALVRNVTVRQPTPTGAAALRVMASIGPAEVKRAAGRELGELTADKVFPPEWVTSVGKPVPVAAWRSYDVFGDGEFIVVTFAYGTGAGTAGAGAGEAGADHAVIATVNRAVTPVVTKLAVVTDAAKAVEMVRDMAEPLSRQEEIPLAEARRRLEGPLAHAAADPLDELDDESVAFLPVVRNRVRRLPAAGVAGTTFSAADRAAAVAEFMASSYAASASVSASGGDPDVVRFWAQVLTGYSGRVPDESPYQVGPGKLAGALLTHVPDTFTLTPAERDDAEAAVTAWARWAAERQGLDETAVTHLLDALPSIFADFEEVYADPHAAASRAYVRDVVTSDLELADLADLAARRSFAAPYPGLRAKELASVDATKASGRGLLVVGEFGSCKDPADRKPFVNAVSDVVEELWHGKPAATWAQALRLSAEGRSRHDVLHALAEHR